MSALEALLSKRSALHELMASIETRIHEQKVAELTKKATENRISQEKLRKLTKISNSLAVFELMKVAEQRKRDLEAQEEAKRAAFLADLNTPREKVVYPRPLTEQEVTKLRQMKDEKELEILMSLDLA